jgi:hypothetical protein
VSGLEDTLETEAATGPADPADVALCRKVWLAATGTVPREAEAMLARNECYFVLLLLLERMYGERLTRWRIAFADNGSAYRSTVWIADEAGRTRSFEGRHDRSMLRSMVEVIDQVKGEPRGAVGQPRL